MNQKRRRSRRTPLFEKVVHRIASKWVAGNSIADALKSAKNANSKGMSAIINYLGEHTLDDDQIEENVLEYLTIMNKMNLLRIDGSITPKLTQIGLDRDYSTCEKNALRIVERAKELKKFVWIDMESSTYVEDTIQIYFALLKRYEMVGLAFQAYLKHAVNYLVDILMQKGKVRLVKGAYKEESDVAYRSKALVDKNYMKLMQMLFEDGDNFAIATHDQVIIERAMKLNNKYHKRFEFQMLKGIRDDIKPELIKEGFNLAEYIPYGQNITAYSVRRIKEKPSNILLLARSLF